MAYYPSIENDPEIAAHVSVKLLGDRTKENVVIKAGVALVDAGFDQYPGGSQNFYGFEVVPGDDAYTCKIALAHDGTPPSAMIAAFDSWVATRNQ